MLWLSWECMHVIYQKIEKFDMDDVLRLEFQLAVILAEMEYLGIGISTDLLTNSREKAQSTMKSLEDQAHKLAGAPFLLTSPAQVAQILFENLKLQPPKVLAAQQVSSFALQ